MGYLNIIRDIIDITCHKLYDINYSANISSINSKILSMFLDLGYWISNSLWGIWLYMLIYEIYDGIWTFYGISIYIFSVTRWCPPSPKSFLIIPWTIDISWYITNKNQLVTLDLFAPTNRDSELGHHPATFPRRRLLGQELLLLRFRHLHLRLLQVLERDRSATIFDVNLETHWKENHGNHKFFLHSDVFLLVFSQGSVDYSTKWSFPSRENPFCEAFLWVSWKVSWQNSGIGK